MEQDWHGVVKTILTDRVKQLTPENRVDRFLELERRANTPALITNIFITEATTALDEIVFRRVSMYTVCVHFSNMFPLYVSSFLNSQQHTNTKQAVIQVMVTHRLTLTSSQIIDQLTLWICLEKF